MWFQAREDVICMLKAKPTAPQALESRYGFAVPGSALQALQRDGFIKGTERHSHSVYQKPMIEVSYHYHTQRCFCWAYGKYQTCSKKNFCGWMLIHHCSLNNLLGSSIPIRSPNTITVVDSLMRLFLMGSIVHFVQLFFLVRPWISCHCSFPAGSSAGEAQRDVPQDARSVAARWEMPPSHRPRAGHRETQTCRLHEQEWRLHQPVGAGERKVRREREIWAWTQNDIQHEKQCHCLDAWVH